jgi:hypothetical protein
VVAIAIDVRIGETEALQDGRKEVAGTQGMIEIDTGRAVQVDLTTDPLILRTEEILPLIHILGADNEVRVQLYMDHFIVIGAIPRIRILRADHRPPIHIQLTIDRAIVTGGIIQHYRTLRAEIHPMLNRNGQGQGVEGNHRHIDRIGNGPMVQQTLVSGRVTMTRDTGGVIKST